MFRTVVLFLLAFLVVVEHASAHSHCRSHVAKFESPGKPIFFTWGPYTSTAPHSNRKYPLPVDWSKTENMVQGITAEKVLLVQQKPQQHTDISETGRIHQSFYKRWLDRDGRLAMLIPVKHDHPDTITVKKMLAGPHGARNGMKTVAAFIHRGYNYVAINELGRDPFWLNMDNQIKFAQMLKLLRQARAPHCGDDPLYFGRVILYVNTYNMRGRLHRYKTVLEACRVNCRIIASQIYLNTAEAINTANRPFSTSREHAGQCANQLKCIDHMALEMARATPGVNRNTITVFDLRALNYSFRNRATNCRGLRLQFVRRQNAGYAKNQPGFGFYTPIKTHVKLRGEQSRCISGFSFR